LVVALLAALSGSSSAQRTWSDAVGVAEAMGVRVGLTVVDVDSGATIASHRADESFLPASNQKILTAAAALRGLGGDFEFETGFRVRRGWLEVIAGGDPNWRAGTDHDPVRLFDRCAGRLRDAGVTRLRGVLIVRGPFGGPSRPPDWPEDQLHLHYCAPTGAVVLEGGCFVARISAEASAATARIEILAPPAPFRIGGWIDLTPDPRRGSRYGIDVDGLALRARGQFHDRASSRTVRASVTDPELVFESALTAAIGGRGVSFDADAEPVDLDLPTVRTPLIPTLGRMLKESSNFDAEQCMRVLGAVRSGDGSLAGGARAIERELRSMCGELPDGLVVADGSGLSRGNRVTPRLLCRVLVSALHEPFGPLFVDTLPQAAVDGTLERRFRDSDLVGRVRAKTGTIRGVSALSGVVRSSGGKLLAFSIVMNFSRQGRGPDLRELQEQIVASIARGAE
jgi:D-alanyl-D-alanine carboxypeptidase/D-alanyl-D-alanine-endopeptidase (penicillin-binding protein 4)